MLNLTYSPKKGHAQVVFWAGAERSLLPMARQPEPSYVDVLGDNLERLMGRKPRAAHPRSARSVADAAGLNKNTVQRLLNRDANLPAVDTLDAIARVFGLRAHQMLVPGLDPLDPPILTTQAKIKAQARQLFNAYVQALTQGAKTAALVAGSQDSADATDPFADRANPGRKPGKR